MLAYQTEKFKLTAGPCAADGYFVTIQGGAFVGSDGKGFAVPSGHTLEGNWGASGTVWSSGDDLHPAPERLSLTWFSYAEDKLYQGTFLLPQEKIYHLLKQGSWDIEKQQQVPYNELTVCVLPKGVVVVWLTGGNQVLLGRYQAPEKFLGHEELVRYYGEGVDRTAMVHETWDEMPAEVQAEIKAGTLSTRRWDQWLQTYPWQVAFAQPFALYEYSANFVNAERVNDPLTRDGLDAYRAVVLTPTPKPLPRALRFLGQAPHKARFLVRVRHFDEAELRAAVERLLREHPGAPLTFYFALDKPYQKATLSLKNQWKEIPLPGSPVEVFNQQ